MNTINDRKIKLIEKLKNREYRDSFVTSSVDVGVAFQIRALRKKKKYTQNALAEMANMKQERISALENPDRAPNISTLQRLANAFDMGLIVEIAPISKLVEKSLNLSEESFNVPSFDEDPYFQTKENETEISPDSMELPKEAISSTPNNIIDMTGRLAKKTGSSSPQDIPPPIVSDGLFRLRN